MSCSGILKNFTFNILTRFIYDVSSSQLDPLLSTTREVMEVIEVTSVFNSCYTLHEINMEMMQSNPKKKKVNVFNGNRPWSVQIFEIKYTFYLS